jgi:hypothetical protein
MQVGEWARWTRGRYNMSAYSVVVVGVLIVVACTLIAVWTLAEKLLSQ